MDAEDAVEVGRGEVLRALFHQSRHRGDWRLFFSAGFSPIGQAAVERGPKSTTSRRCWQEEEDAAQRASCGCASKLIDGRQRPGCEGGKPKPTNSAAPKSPVSVSSGAIASSKMRPASRRVFRRVGGPDAGVFPSFSFFSIHCQLCRTCVQQSAGRSSCFI